MEISVSELISFPLERIPKLLAEITLRTWFVTFELLVIYRTAIGSAYLTVRVNLGLARFLSLLRHRYLIYSRLQVPRETSHR